MSSTVNFVSLGDHKYRLENPGGSALGWIRGRAIGLLGLRDVDEALSWAPALRHALDNTLGRYYPERYRPLKHLADLRLVHDGAYEWIAARNVPIARVHRPVSRKSDRYFTIEFVLPSYAGEMVTIACAEMLASMLNGQILSSSGMCETNESTSRTAAAGRRSRKRTRVSRSWCGPEAVPPSILPCRAHFTREAG